jgi:hypothetical protein
MPACKPGQATGARNLPDTPLNDLVDGEIDVGNGEVLFLRAHAPNRESDGVLAGGVDNATRNGKLGLGPNVGDKLAELIAVLIERGDGVRYELMESRSVGMGDERRRAVPEGLHRSHRTCSCQTQR